MLQHLEAKQRRGSRKEDREVVLEAGGNPDEHVKKPGVSVSITAKGWRES